MQTIEQNEDGQIDVATPNGSRQNNNLIITRFQLTKPLFEKTNVID